MTSISLLDTGALESRAQRDLDWELLLDRIAGMATSAPGARRLRARTMEPEWESARVCMERTAEALSLHDEGLSIPIGDLPDLADLIARLERGMTATGLELRDLGRMLESAKVLRQFVLSQRHTRPVMSTWLEVAAGTDPLCERIARSVDQDGSLKDDATAALGRVRLRAKQVRQELVAELKRLMHRHADLLRDQYYSERDGRYVIPVRSDAHRGVEGVVLDTSASGNTLFVEPRELTPIANQLRVALSEVAHEEQRILRELSSAAKALAPELHQAENACAEADVLAALVRWGSHTDSVAILPENAPMLELRAVRHPLLVGQGEVIPNDLDLAAGTALVLSGPNAGGKTVSLKCLGLTARMARAGIPLCVDRTSRIGFYSAVYTEIGDSQSIVASLSTFSAHVLMLASILAQASASTLVLLDEVAGGTDPEQGAALAAAYLEELLDRGVAVAATTHYETLKELGNTDPRFRNAAVGFDVTTMLPTFRVLNGVAGPSTALAVATRFGIPAQVIDRANAIIPKFSRERERLLEDLASERSLAERMRRDAERDATEQRRLRLELEEERGAVRTTFQRHLEQEYRELLGRIRTARTDLDTVRQRLRDFADKKELSRLENEIDVAAHTIALGSPLSEAIRSSSARSATEGAPQERDLVPGKRVHVARLGMDVEILEPPRKGSVRVRAAGITLSVALADITRANDRRAPPKKRPNEPRKTTRGREAIATVTLAAAPMRIDQNTLDLRGERVDEALERVERFIDEMLRRGEVAAYILHGHGTGALKQAVRQHVRGLKSVRDSAAAPPEDGGDAFTLVWLDR